MINGAVIGFLVASRPAENDGWRGHPPPPPPPFGGEPHHGPGGPGGPNGGLDMGNGVIPGFLMPALRFLPTADAAVLEDAFAQRASELTRLRRQMAERGTALSEKMAEPQLDAAAFQTEFMALRDDRQRYTLMVDQALIDAFPRMSLAGRQMMASQFPRQ